MKENVNFVEKASSPQNFANRGFWPRTFMREVGRQEHSMSLLATSDRNLKNELQFFTKPHGS